LPLGYYGIISFGHQFFLGRIAHRYRSCVVAINLLPLLVDEFDFVLNQSNVVTESAGYFLWFIELSETV
jgi:hypothetical protein